MGIIRSKLVRPLKTFNVENRAQKIINQEKPKAAPYYPSVYEQIKVAKEVSPNFMEEHYKQDSELYNRLKDVFITSDMTEHPKIEQKKEKTLPFSTRTPTVFEFGFWEPPQVPEGKVYFKEILKMLIDHTANKKENNAEKLAEQYKLDLKDVENLLEYYRVLQIVKPKQREHGFREEDTGLPTMNYLGMLEWKAMDQLKKWKQEDLEEEARMKKEKETQKNDPSELSQTDKETESSQKDKETELPRKDKETELSQKDKETESSKIDQKKGVV